jgi:hypothetical protein
LVNLQTTLSGFELTLTTLVEISQLIVIHDERLAQISPELPQIGSARNGQLSTSGFSEMLAAYQQVFAAFEEASRAVTLLGLDGGTPQLKIEQHLQPAPEPDIVAPISAPISETERLEFGPFTDESDEDDEPIEDHVPDLVASDVREESLRQPDPTQPEPAKKSPQREAEIVPQLAVTGGGQDELSAHRAPAGQWVGETPKPLKPIEMPSVQNELGPMIYGGQSAIYVLGSEIRKYWPGAGGASEKLSAGVPNESWRLLGDKAKLYCVHEDQVSILNQDDLRTTKTLPGRFVAHAVTDNLWAGIQEEGARLSLTFRNQDGSTITGAENIGKFPSGPIYITTLGDVAFVGTANGELFRAEGTCVESFYDSKKRGSLIGLAASQDTLLLTNQGPDGAWLTTVDLKGKVLHQSKVVAKSMSHQPILLEDKAVFIDDARSEVVIVSLESLQEVDRRSVEGVSGVLALLLCDQEGGPGLAILAKSDAGRPVGVYVHSIQTGTTMKLCHLNADCAHIANADGHVVVASSSSMQNLVQVFHVYAPALARAA